MTAVVVLVVVVVVVVVEVVMTGQASGRVGGCREGSGFKLGSKEQVGWMMQPLGLSGGSGSCRRECLCEVLVVP